jgi:hypothetical protein
MLEDLRELRDVHACSRIFFAMGTILLATYGDRIYHPGSHIATQFARAEPVRRYTEMYAATSESPVKSLVRWSFRIA